MEFHLFPACLSHSFSDMICSEQFVSFWLSHVQNQEMPASPHYIRDAVVCQLLHCVSSLGGKFLQGLEQGLHDRSALFWGILKGAKHVWVQGSPKILCYNSAAQFKIKVSLWWSLISHSCRPRRFLCERNHQPPCTCWKKQTRKKILLGALFTVQRGNGIIQLADPIFISLSKHTEKSVIGFIQTNWPKEPAGKGPGAGCWAAAPATASQCHLVMLSQLGPSTIAIHHFSSRTGPTSLAQSRLRVGRLWASCKCVFFSEIPLEGRVLGRKFLRDGGLGPRWCPRHWEAGCCGYYNCWVHL